MSQLRVVLTHLSMLLSSPPVTRYGMSQSPALVHMYDEFLFGKNGSFPPGSIQSAKHFWTIPPDLNNYDHVYTPSIGSIFVGLGGIYHPEHGHCGVVYDMDLGSGEILTYEQNADGHRGPGRYRRNLDNILGFLTPTLMPWRTERPMLRRPHG